MVVVVVVVVLSVVAVANLSARCSTIRLRLSRGPLQIFSEFFLPNKIVRVLSYKMGSI